MKLLNSEEKLKQVPEEFKQITKRLAEKGLLQHQQII